MWQEEKRKPPSHPSAHGLLKWLEAIRYHCIDFSTHTSNWCFTQGSAAAFVSYLHLHAIALTLDTLHK